MDCQGAILFTGVGKSGFIAQKVCQTLVSTGTKVLGHHLDSMNQISSGSALHDQGLHTA
jgi:D-arabinose 5-phosphate isomerase GutQ